MQVKLYFTNSDNSEINKKLQLITTIDDVHPVEPVDITAPTFKIGSKTLDFLQNANYAYVPDYHRYYYINPLRAFNNGISILSMEVDPLVSFKSSILKLPVIAQKVGDEDNSNMDYNDGSFCNQEGNYLEIKHYEKGFSESPINILITAGG